MDGKRCGVIIIFEFKTTSMSKFSGLQMPVVRLKNNVVGWESTGFHNFFFHRGYAKKKNHTRK